MSSEFKALAAAAPPHRIPDGATAFRAVNAVDITTTTKQEIKAAVVGKCHYITEAACYNKTTAEDQVLMLRHGTTDVAILHPTDVADGAGGGANAGGMRVFNPPIKIPVGVAIDGIGVIATVGDCVIEAGGYVGDDNGD